MAILYKSAVIDATTAGDATLVAAVAGKQIQVHAILLSASGASTLRLEDGVSGTALTGTIDLNGNKAFVMPFSPVPWVTCTVATLLNAETTGTSISLDGVMIYSLI
jgi:hypothetical protein